MGLLHARVIPDTNATFSYVLPVNWTFGDESVTKSAMRIFSEDLPQKAQILPQNPPQNPVIKLA
jgi:hypothetical protein